MTRGKNVRTKPATKLRVYLMAFSALALVLVAFFVEWASNEIVLGEDLEFYGIRLTKARFEKSKDGELHLVSTAPIRKAEKIFHIPRSLCITEKESLEGDAGFLFRQSEEIIIETLKSLGLSLNVKPILLFSFHVALERRNSLSSLQRWFNTIPKFDRSNGGAVYWDDDDLSCLEPTALSQARTVRLVLLAMKKISSGFCLTEDDCPGGPLSEAELQWALAVYFQYNVRDQAIIPFVTFAGFGSHNFGIDVKMNAKNGGLDVVSDDNFQKGDKLQLYFPRGPGVLLAARGTFDTSAVGVDANIDIRNAFESSKGKKICVDRFHELVFGANGKPRTALLKCFAWTVGTNSERQNIDSFEADKNLMQKVYLGLVHHIEKQLSQIPEKCSCSQPRLERSITKANEFSKRVLEENKNHLQALLHP